MKEALIGILCFAIGALLTIGYNTYFSSAKEVSADVYDINVLEPPYDPNDLTDGGYTIIDSNWPDWKAEQIVINEAIIERAGENKIKCSTSHKKFWKAVYNCLDGDEATGDIEIQWADTNEPAYDPNDMIYKFIPVAHKSWIKQFGDNERTRLFHAISEIRVIQAELGRRILDMEMKISDPVDNNERR